MDVAAGMQLDMFGTGSHSGVTHVPPMLTESGWQIAETQALVLALRQGSLPTALAVLNRVTVETAWRVLLEAGFTVGARKDRAGLLASVEHDLILAAQKGITGHEVRAIREAEKALAPTAEIPPAVRNSVMWAIGRLDGIAKQLEGVQRARGDGVFLAVEYRDQLPELEKARAALAEFRERARAKGIEPETLIKELGGEPDFSRFGEPASADVSLTGGMVSKVGPVLGNADSDATLSRTRDRSEIRFQTPYVGKTGAALVGYVWPNKKEEYIDQRGEERVRTVSDWDQAIENLKTGRQIIHQFAIRTPNGAEQDVSAETAAIMLGIAESTVRSSARRLLETEIGRARKLAAEVREADKVDAITAADTPAAAVENSATTYNVDSAMVIRMASNGPKWFGMEGVERESAGREKYRFLVRGEKYVWSPELVREGSELYRRGWRNEELRADQVWTAKEKQRDTGKRAVAGGQVAESNGYFYKGGQFLPTTSAEPGKWKIGNKWITSGRELIAPGEFADQPTPFSRSIFTLLGRGAFLEHRPDGTMTLKSGIRDNSGEPLTLDTEVRPGVQGVLGRESLTIRELLHAYNTGQRWFDVNPEGKTLATQQSEHDNTDDAGEELVYNKRNRRGAIKWEDIKDQDAALRVSETVKAKVLEKPDYQALIAGGMQPLIAHIVKQAYDSVAAKPQTRSAPTDEQLKLYIEGVNRFMDGVMAWANGPESIEWLKQIGRHASVMSGAMRGQQVSVMALAEKPTKSLLETVYPGEHRTRFSRDGAYHAEVILIGGNKALGALQPSTDEAVKAMKDIEKGWPGKQEAWQKQGYRIIAGDNLAVDYYEGQRSRSEGAFVNVFLRLKDGTRAREVAYELIEGAESRDDARVKEVAERMLGEVRGKHVLVDKNFRPVGIYESEDAAMEAARNNTKRKTAGVKEVGISVEMAAREGVERRMDGEDVSSEKLMETFGFRGINFGNWMKGKGNEAERQLHLNHAYDAFMDLAEIVGVPPKAMSLNGMLGLAVGAQGNGRAAAHFVPGLNEINITRTAGAGALAHEWGHALDHHFARLAGLERESEPYLTAHTSRAKRGRPVVENGRTVMKNDVEPYAAELRPEVLEKFRTIVKAMNKRDLSAEEVAERKVLGLTQARKQVDSWLSSIRRDFMAPRLQGKVSEASFDALAERIRKLDLGEGSVAVSQSTYIAPVVDELRQLYKQATGRSYNIDQIKGLQSWVDSLKYRSESKADDDVHVPQQTTSRYAANAAALDKDKGGKPYWSTDLEKFARAFDAFVSDELEGRAAKNSYLAGLNKDEMTSPMGDERKAINAAFRGLVETIETRETEKGVAMFSRADSARTNRIAVETAVRRMSKFVDEFETRGLKDNDSQVIGETPTVLQALGADNLPLHIDGATVRKILASKHGSTMTADLLRALPEGIYDPIAVFDSPNTITGAAGKMLVTEMHDRRGRPVVAVVHLEKRGNRMLVNDIASAYGLENFQNRSKVAPSALQYVRDEKALATSTTSDRLFWADVVQKARELAVRVLTETDIVKQYGERYSRQAAQTIDSHTRESLAEAIDQAFPETPDFMRRLEATGKFSVITAADIPASLGDDVRFRKTGLQVDRIAMTPLQPDQDTLIVDGVERPTRNSNGDPIHWSKEGVRNFWEWFGDSKAVDQAGRPLVMYHGTNDKFVRFEHDHPHKKDGGWLGKGFYFTNNEAMARSYTNLKAGADATIMPVYLAVKAPFMATARDKEPVMLAEHRGDRTAAPAMTERLRGEGHDGAILDYGTSDGAIEVMVFDAPQIKSATQNIGTFTELNPDIRFSADGRILGFVVNDHTYLVADNIDRTENDVRGLLLHEIGVHALRVGRGAPEFEKIKEDFEVMLDRGDKDVLKAYERVPKSTKPHLVTEEAIGYFVEDNPELSFSQRVASWFKQQVAKICNVFRAGDTTLGQWANSLTKEDLVFMASRATRSAPDALMQGDRAPPAGIPQGKDGMYIGKVLGVEHGWVIQSRGDGGRVAHRACEFEGKPETGALMEVKCKSGHVTGAKAVVRESAGRGR